MRRPVVLILGPSLEAISGVSTHVASLLGSRLASRFALAHFPVGSEGRAESRLARAARLAAGPFLLACAILRHDAAIVHLNTSLNARAWWRDFAFLLVAKLCGARVVLQKHGGALEEFASNRLFTRVLKMLLKIPDAIVVLSQAELEAFQAFVPGQNVAVLPNGIDPAPYAGPDRRLRDSKAELKLIYIGRLAPRKGLDEAIQALALARAGGLRLRLIIAGSGPEEARLRRRVREFGLAGQVSFAGPAWGAAKVKLLGGADALLLPSYSEGLPYALLEAMAAGAVPVVTPVGAIPEVVTEGVHGCFVAPRDPESIARALAALDADRQRLARMSQACRQRIAGAYSLERFAADFCGLYATLSQCPASQAG